MTANMNDIIRAAAGHGSPPEADDDDDAETARAASMNDRIRAASHASRHRLPFDEALRQVQSEETR